MGIFFKKNFFYLGVHKGCKEGCTVNQCLNGGDCIEKWGEGHYECDCSQSNFAGKRCELGEYTVILHQGENFHSKV